MLFNYHTHTTRCNHATGNEREYVENAIKSGLKTLGFADHAPYLFPNGYQSGFRMKTEQLFEYAEVIRSLAKEYEKDIRILCGFELEYYPDFHAEQMAFLRQVQPDYLLMGQHFIGAEIGTPHISSQASHDLLLTAYVSQVIAGLSTGDFLYLAHPDLPGMAFTPEVCRAEYTRLCEFAKRKNIPLEINLLGLATNRKYPSRGFFEIAANVGNDIVLGIDAHNPEAILDKATQQKALDMAKDLGLHLITQPLL